MDRLYSIVVPTRERPDVLRSAIATVLSLTRSNYELVVMDNCSSPETRAVVESFHHDKIVYVRSEERLSMADNWECGLASASGDYITFLGDDDGMFPDAIEIAERFHDRWPDQIISWRPFVWVWPDSPVTRYQSHAQMHFGSHAEWLYSRPFLKDLLSSRVDFTQLPTTYCSFVPRAIIDSVRKEHGRFFLASVPDISSAFVILAFSERFLYSHRPLTAWGISRHSTGASQWFGVGSAAEVFDAENRAVWSTSFDDRLSGGDFIVEVMLADLYLKMLNKLFINDTDLRFDFVAFLRSLCTTGARRFGGRWNKVRQAIASMASKNGLDPKDFEPEPPDDEDPPILYYDILAEKSIVRFNHYTDPRYVHTIEDFVSYAIRLCVSPGAVRMGGIPVGDTGITGNLSKDLMNIANERLALINELSRVCDERLTLINQLQSVCDERLALINELGGERAGQPIE